MIKKDLGFNLMVQVVLCILSLNALGQKHFNLTVKLPQEVVKDKVELYLDNGKALVPIKSQPSGEHEMLLTGKYYSLYAYVSIQTQIGLGTTAQTVGNSFFIQDKPGVIEFYSTDSTNIFDRYSLKNVLDFKNEKRQIALVDTAERRIGREMEVKYGESLFDGKDTAASRYYFKVLRNAQGRKQLEYIMYDAPNFQDRYLRYIYSS